MIRIRPAANKDEKEILRLLDEADLRYRQESLDGFRVAEIEGEIAGIVRIKEFPDFLFLTSLGVAKAHRDRGVASALVNKATAEAKKPVYLYTIIPEFFKKLGFKIEENPPRLPSREIYGCDECLPGKCVVMKRDT